MKSQWAHRFGVESLEELNNLDLNEISKKNEEEVNKKNDESHNPYTESNNLIISEVNDFPDKEIQNDSTNIVNSTEIDKEIIGAKSYEIKKVNDSNHEKGRKVLPKVETLIPLPPKAKYSFLEKWLLKS